MDAELKRRGSMAEEDGRNSKGLEGKMEQRPKKKDVKGSAG